MNNKSLYKIFLNIVKYLPMTLALFQIVLTTLNYFGIAAIGLTYLGGSSVLFVALLYIISYVFKYCYLYRIPLWYITLILFLGMLRTFGLLPLDLLDLYRLYTIISGLFTLLFIGYAYKNRNNPNNKIDYIKDLCERYCKCEN